MGVIANLLISIGADTKELGAGLDKATKQVQRFGADLESAGLRLTAGISLPLVGIGTAALQAAGKMEQNRVAFTTLLKSADAAKAHLEELKKFALVTPFQFEDLTKASRLMQAYGFSASDVVPKLRTIGNAVAALGGGNDVLERVVRSMGEIGTRGKITGEQLRELSRAGIPALEAIAQKLGISVAEAQAKITAGMVDAKTASDALLTYMDKRFAGGMEQQSKTLLGMWSNIKDKLSFTLVAIGDALIPWAKSFVSDTLDPMLAKVKDLAEAFGKLPRPVQDVALGAAGAAVAFPLLTVAIGATITNSIVIAGAMAKLYPLLVSVSAAIAGPMIAACQTFAVWLGTLTTAAGLAVSAGFAVLIVAVYKLLDAWRALKDAQDAQAAQEQQRADALSKLEGSLRQQGIQIDYLRKQYDAGSISIDTYVSLLRELVTTHVKVNGASKDLMNTQAALDALNLKSTAQRKADLEQAKLAYEVLKKSGEGHQVLAEAALRVQQAEAALNGELSKANDKYETITRTTLESAINTELYNRAIARQGELIKDITDYRLSAFRQAWHSIIVDGPATIDTLEAMAKALDKSDKLVGQIGKDAASSARVALDASLYGQLEESARFFGITTSGEYREIANTASEEFERMKRSGLATYDELAVAALKSAQAQINADRASGGRVNESDARQIDADLKKYEHASDEKLDAEKQLASETRRLNSRMFTDLERGLASSIVHWQSFGKAVKSIFQNLGEDILGIFFHALLKPVEKIFGDLLASIAEKLLGMFITTKVAASAVDVGEVAGAAAVGGAAAAASTAAIPIIGPALAMEAGAAMYAAILGTYGPLAMFKQGGVVGDDMLAGLHKNEMVLPADIAVPLRSMVRGQALQPGMGGIHFYGPVTGVTRETVDLLANKLIRGARFAGARI